MISRNGHDLTAAIPELDGLADLVPSSDTLLDGELIAADGRPDSFYRLLPAMTARRHGAVARRQATVSLTSAAFDVGVPGRRGSAGTPLVKAAPTPRPPQLLRAGLVHGVGAARSDSRHADRCCGARA